MAGMWFVTGAAGFIGSNVVEHLLRAGETVVGFDNFATGTRKNVERLQRAGSRFTFVEGDIRDAATLERSAQGAGAVVHLAAQVRVQESFRDYAYNNAVNVDGFLNALKAAAAARARAFIYASSCAVYGDNPALPLRETSDVRPLSPYGVSKLANEGYAAVLDPELAETTLVGLRFFNIYGPWQDARGAYAAVIAKWLEACLRGERPVMFGDGSATRDFCFVDDVARLIAGVGRTNRKRPHGIYNVGTGEKTTLTELFAALADALAASGKRLAFDSPRGEPWRAGDIVHSLADVTRARAELGFAPATDIRAGLGRILALQHGIGR
ncbi:MAG: SDR family NAD(P)-dependent oxidoreductase [Rhodospirillales bacterium]|nr:SDR family NAD(P)-dependent oxidoreductase [Rhodospirillales bacterium]